jgi:O-antigen ligase
MAVATALVFFLFSGQGVRYLIGLPAYGGAALFLFVLTVAAFWKRWKKPPLLLSLFLLLAGASATWSQTPSLTAVAVVILLLTTGTAMALVGGLSPRRRLMALYRGLQLSLVVGLGFEVIVGLIGQPAYPLFHEWLSLVPADGISPETLQWSTGALFSGGPLQGFVGNRNLFGFIALLAAILAPLLLKGGWVRRTDALATLLLAVGVHMLTGSATVTLIAAAVLVLAVAAYLLRRTPLRWRRFLSWAFVAMAGGVAFAAYSFRDVVTLMLGRDPDLTDRTAIWRSVFDVILQYPQGTGWVSYWPVWEAPYKGLITLGGTPIAQAHNAFLDVWLQLSPFGALLLLALFATSLIAGWEQVEDSRPGGTVVPLAWVLLGVALGLQAVSESRLLLEGNWFLFTLVVASVPQLIQNRGRFTQAG